MILDIVIQKPSYYLTDVGVQNPLLVTPDVKICKYLTFAVEAFGRPCP